MVEHAPCAYVSLTSAGRFQYVNRTFLRWTGHAAERLNGERLSDLLTMAGRIYYETHIAPLLRMQSAAPPRQAQRTEHACRQLRPGLGAESHRQQGQRVAPGTVRRHEHAAYRGERFDARGSRRCVLDGERPRGGVGELKRGR